MHFILCAIDQTTQESRLTREKLTAKKIESFMQSKISFDLGENGHHRPSGLGGRLTAVVTWQDKTLAVNDLFYNVTTSVLKDD